MTKAEKLRWIEALEKTISQYQIVVMWSIRSDFFLKGVIFMTPQIDERMAA